MIYNENGTQATFMKISEADRNVFLNLCIKTLNAYRNKNAISDKIPKSIWIFKEYVKTSV